jgi:hypothetical protein
MNQNQAKKLKRSLFQYWKDINPKIREKFNNLNGKTGQYNVPEKLFQKRTSRQNRVLIPWKTINQNNITVEQLKTFFGGVCVEFVNDDYFNPKYDNSSTHSYLKSLVGAKGLISAMVSFRTEDGDSGAAIPRHSFNQFNKLIEEGLIDFTQIPILRDENVKYNGRGSNDVWKGNIYFSIKGGEQNSIESHTNEQSPQLFNPATEYANELVCLDMDIVMSYFCLYCYDLKNYIRESTIFKLKSDCERYLKTRDYDEGNLFEYCVNHPSIKLGSGVLIDAIQLNNISIEDFKTSGLENSSVICHNEAANKDKFYFDNKNNFLVSPARPTNLFWSTHLSNMMQQNFNLKEYYEKEDLRVKKRKALL